MAPDDYRPDPPAGLDYADFRAARARFLARLAAQSEIARRERAWGLDFPGPVVDATAPGGAGGRIAAERRPRQPGVGGSP